MISFRLLAVLLVTHVTVLGAQSAPPPFTWKVPDRFGIVKRDGLVDYHWNAQTARYDDTWINVTRFPVAFDACKTAGSGAITWEFRDASSSAVIGRETGRCSLTYQFRENHKTYTVTLTANGRTYDPVPIQIRDLLIVNLGDSFSSGEGAPDIPRGDEDFATWVDMRCHRSAKAGAAQAAIALERIDPHTSITFVSLACSGATIDTEIVDEDGKPTGEGRGLLAPYKGIVPNASPLAILPAQVDMIPSSRPIDAIVIGGGGNDIRFARIIANCTSFIFTCRNDQEALDLLASDLAALPAKFDRLAERLNKLNVRHVLVHEYPDPTKDDSRATCEEMMDDIIEGALEISHEDAQWASDNVLPPLNKVIAEAAQRADRPNGPRWHFVGGISDLYKGSRDGRGHGQCATDNWINTAEESANKQGPDNDAVGAAAVVGAIALAGVTGGAATGLAIAAAKAYTVKALAENTGTMHPNERGYAAVRDRLVEELSRVLFDARVECQEAQGPTAWLPGGIKCMPTSDKTATDCSKFQNDFERATCTAPPGWMTAPSGSIVKQGIQPKCVNEPGEPDGSWRALDIISNPRPDSGTIHIKWLRCFNETTNEKAPPEGGFDVFHQISEREYFAADVSVRRSRNPARVAARGYQRDLIVESGKYECSNGVGPQINRVTGDLTWNGKGTAEAHVVIQQTSEGFQLEFSVDGIEARTRNRGSNSTQRNCDRDTPQTHDITEDQHKGGIEFTIPLGKGGEFPAEGVWSGPIADPAGRVGMMTVTWNLHVPNARQNSR